MIIEGYFCQFSIKSCSNVGTHWKHLALLMSTHNFCSYRVIRNLIAKYHTLSVLLHLVCPFLSISRHTSPMPGFAWKMNQSVCDTNNIRLTEGLCLQMGLLNSRP